MITKVQYDFINAFIEVGKSNLETDDTLKSFNRQKVKIEQFEEILEKFPELVPSEPFSNKKGSPDELTPGMLVSYLEIFIESAGLKNIIVHDSVSSDCFILSSQAYLEIEEYRRTVEIVEISKKSNSLSDEANKISAVANEKSQNANTISIIALVLAGLSLLSAIGTLILEIINVCK